MGSPTAVPADARAEYEKYLAATEHVGFVKDFFPALEALMMDPAETYGQRFLAWLKRRSWGNYRLYAVLESGEPATQADCSRELGIDKRIVSNSVRYYEKRGYLYRKDKLLYPTISPKVTPPSEKVTRSSDFLEFLEEWKVTHSTDFLALEVARSEVERIRKVILSDYQKSQRARTNGGPTLYRDKEDLKTDEPPASQPNVKVEEVCAPEPKPAGRLAADDSEPQHLKAEIQQHLETIPIPEKPSHDVVEEIATHITTPALLQQFKEATAPLRFTKGPPRKWALIIRKAKETAIDGPRFEKAKAAVQTNGSPPSVTLQDILRGKYPS